MQHVGSSLQHAGSFSCSMQTLNCGMWDLPRPGLEPVSPALAGRFSTTAPPGKPPSREFLISFFVLFFIVCLFFSSSRSLFNVSYIFSVLFPRFWIIFTTITLNSFSGRLPISSSFVRSGGFLPCFFICCIFLCLLILLYLLYLASPFRRLQVRSSRCFWCLPPLGKVGSVACVDFLVEGTGARVLVAGAEFCLSGGQGHIRWCVLGCL